MMTIKEMTAGGDVIEGGYYYHADHSHCGSLSCAKEVLEEKGVLADWEEPDEEAFYIFNTEWELEENRTQYADEYKEEKDRWMNTYTHYIAHCFNVTAPDGSVLGYGDETPHGKIGSQEFTLWWNGLALDTLEYADMDSWCDG